MTATPEHLTAARSTPNSSQSGPPLRYALAVMTAGAAVVIAGAVPGVTSVHRSARALGGGVMPGMTTVQLTRGTWEIFTTGNGSLDGDEVSIGARGAVPRTPTFGTERILDGRRYTGQLVFTTSSAGAVRLQLEGEPGARYFVARTYQSSYERAAGWFVLAGGGVLAVIAGVVMASVGSSRRRRLTQPLAPWGAAAPGIPWQPPPAYHYPAQPAPMPTPPPPTGPPPGWYADPAYASTDHRWWDGTQWTHHVQPKPQR